MIDLLNDWLILRVQKNRRVDDGMARAAVAHCVGPRGKAAKNCIFERKSVDDEVKTKSNRIKAKAQGRRSFFLLFLLLLHAFVVVIHMRPAREPVLLQNPHALGRRIFRSYQLPLLEHLERPLFCGWV